MVARRGWRLFFDTREIERLLGLENCQFDYFSCYLATVVYDSGPPSPLQEFPKLSDAIQEYSRAWIEENDDAAKELLSDVVFRVSNSCRQAQAHCVRGGR